MSPLLPVAGIDMAKCTTVITSPSSFDANESGVNSVTSAWAASSSKNFVTSARPLRIPCHGATSPRASEAQSTSSVTCSRMCSTSPRPNASSIPCTVLMF